MQNEQNQNLNNPNLASQGEVLQNQNALKSPILKNKWLKIGIGFVILLTIIGGAYFLGKNSPSPKIQDQIAKTASPTPTATSIPTTNPTPTLSTLKIPEYGVQIALSDEIKDAYYINTTAAKGYVYLKVHSLDTEPQCKKDDSSTAALSRVGKDEVNQMNDKKYSDSFKGTILGNYFYYIDLAQYVCAESVAGKATLEKVRAAFTSAIITQ